MILNYFNPKFNIFKTKYITFNKFMVMKINNFINKKFNQDKILV